MCLRIILAFSITLTIAFVSLDRLAPAGRRLVKIRGEDPVAYFGIAHSVLFDRDFNLNNEYARMPPDGRFWTATRPETGLPGSPWGLGYSLLEVPLLALGTGVDAIAGNPADGYSQWAVFFYCIGSLLMASGGMTALFVLLRSAGDFLQAGQSERNSAWALFVAFAVFFGTNVGYYAFSQMSHSSTFLFAALFLAIWWRVRESERVRDWLMLGLAGGFLSICRWQDVLYLGGPLLFDLFGAGRLKWPAWLRNRLVYAAGIGLCWVPQILEWKAIYGKYLTIPQGGGIFSFPPPHMLQVLFSSQGGWFVWTPIALLGAAGLAIGAVRFPRVYLPWIIVLVLQTAVVGSVWFWHGAESFGARYLLSSTPLIGLGIMTALILAPVPLRRGLAVVCFVCCVFTSVFAVQYRFDLVPTETTLTFSELVTDKLRLPAVKERKAAARQALELLTAGDSESAIRILRGAQSLGEDRTVDQYLEKAYRAAGNTAEADAAALRSRKFLDSRLY